MIYHMRGYTITQLCANFVTNMAIHTYMEL